MKAERGKAGPPRAVVLGAGVAGLYAGRVLAALGARVTVLEKEAVVGGLASGVEMGGNFHDLGVHHLHAFDGEIFDDVRQLMGERLRPVRKVAQVRYGRGYRRYPLEFVDILTGIPPWTLTRSVAGLAAQMVRNRFATSEAATAEEALIELYGRPLYEYFFRDFTTDYWGLGPRELSAAFVRRKMPRLSAIDVMKKGLARLGLKDSDGAAVESALREETLWYSPTGSRELPMSLARAIRDDGGTVLTDSPVEAVVLGDDGRVVAVTYPGGREGCDICVSTIPVPALVAALAPAAPEDVQRAAARLAYKPIAVYGLLVRRPKVLDALYVYFRDRLCHRVAEPARSGLEVRPPGHTLLLAEMTCEVGDPRWEGDDAIVRRLIAELADEGLIEADDVVAVNLRRTAHGYPVFRLGFEEDLAVVEEHLAAVTNLRSTGRQGSFSYPNMHGAMRMGADAAREMAAAYGAGPGKTTAPRSTSSPGAPTVPAAKGTLAPDAGSYQPAKRR